MAKQGAPRGNKNAQGPHKKGYSRPKATVGGYVGAVKREYSARKSAKKAADYADTRGRIFALNLRKAKTSGAARMRMGASVTSAVNSHKASLAANTAVTRAKTSRQLTGTRIVRKVKSMPGKALHAANNLIHGKTASGVARNYNITQPKRSLRNAKIRARMVYNKGKTFVKNHGRASLTFNLGKRNSPKKA